MSNIDLLLKEISVKSYNNFLKTRERFYSEEDLRVGFSSMIDSISAETKLNISEERHEYSVLNGRIDSLYGQVILEYKEPNYLNISNNSPKNIKAIEQVKRHILGIEQKQKIKSNRYLGVIFDGYKNIFIRRRNGLWDIDNPTVLDQENFNLLLKRIFSVGIQGKALIIDNLINDFGISSSGTKEAIRSLYENFSENNSGKVNLLFEQWKILFREVCGYDFETKKIEVKELAKTFNIPEGEKDLAKIIFIIHTYYAFFIKLLGAETLTYFKHRDTSYISNISNSNIKYHISKLENGEIFKQEGINNYIEADFFSWYLLSWDDSVSKLVQNIIEKFKNYDFSSLHLEPKEAKDLIKNVYHFLLPQNIRHSLGEYYTPDWLAELTIDKLNIDFSSDARLLDPTCGSGTFLNLLIEKIKQNNPNSSKKEVLNKILHSVVGIDLNPLAVISAKTNYIMALSEYLEEIGGKGIDIPIYLSDSMLAPLEYKVAKNNYYSIPTKVGEFKLPSSLVKDKKLNTFLKIVIEAIEIELDARVFIKKCVESGIKFSTQDCEIAEFFYNQLLDLQKRGLDGIWGNIIKNIFAPAFFEKFDYLVGNPPWINWQTLPEDYRDSIKQYWSEYKVFLHKGLKARLGSAHDDICVLLTYVVMDKYLNANGKLGFILPQNLFQSSGGGDGFRRLQIKDDEFIKVEEVHDFVKVQPFADMGASNKACLVIITKDKKTKYPVDYFKWQKKVKGVIPSDQGLSAILPLLEQVKELAEPIYDNKNNSPWLIADAVRLKVLKKLVGKSKYSARKGVDTSVNGLYWGNISDSKKDGLVVFKNASDIGKKEVKQYETLIEKSLIYPILRGKNISKWKTSSDLFCIIPYHPNGKCLSESELQELYPNAYKYFYKTDPKIIKILEDRGIYQKHLVNAKIPKHGLYNIGDYTFSKYKVVWKALADGMISVVVSTDQSLKKVCNPLIIPDHNVLMVPLNNEDEAYYLCGMLNSSIINEFVKAYISWFFSSHILEHISIPDFDSTNALHKEVSSLAKKISGEKIITPKEQSLLDNLALEILKNNS